MATKTGLKYIICDVATSNYGKTTFLKEVARLLKNHHPNVTVLAKHWRKDECFVWKDPKTGKTILVQTQGDMEESFKYTINYIRAHNDVDIILCARHTHGQTANMVKQIAKQYQYEELDFTHMYPQKFNWSVLGIGMAQKVLSKAIYDLILSL